MRGLGGRIGLGQRHDPLGDIRPQRRNPRGPRLVAQQPIEAFRHEPFLPAPDAGFRSAGLAHDLVGADAVGGQKDDLGPPDMLLGAVAVPGQRFQAAANGGLRVMEIPVRIPQTRTQQSAGNPIRDSNVRFYPLAACRLSLSFGPFSFGCFWKERVLVDAAEMKRPQTCVV